MPDDVMRAVEIAAEARQIARDSRDQCRSEYEGLRSEVREYRDETNRRFDRQDQDRHLLHGENQQKFDRLFRAQYIAIGAGMTISAILSAMATAILPKLMHL